MRERFVCSDCGLRLEGRERNGSVYAYDRAPSDPNEEAKPMLCFSCAEARAEGGQ